jgi:hypothetical protein
MRQEKETSFMTEQELFDWCIETGKARGAELRMAEVPNQVIQAIQADPELRVQAGALLYAASQPGGATDCQMIRAGRAFSLLAILERLRRAGCLEYALEGSVFDLQARIRGRPLAGIPDLFGSPAGGES